MYILSSMYSCYYLYTPVLSYRNIAWVIFSGIETALRKEYKNHGSTEQTLIKILNSKEKLIKKVKCIRFFICVILNIQCSKR